MTDKITSTVILLLLLSSFASYSDVPILPTNAIYELLIIIIFALSSIRIRKSVALGMVFIAGYLIIKLLYNVFINEMNLFDFLMGHKFIFYLLVLLLLNESKTGSFNNFKSVYTIMLYCFLLKYGISIVLALYSRPIVFTENNFELMLILLCSIAKHEHIEKITKVEAITIAVIFFLSGSRSGALCLMFVYLIYSIKHLSLINIIALAVGVVGLQWVIMERMGSSGLAGIDRFFFLLQFIESTRDWDIQWLFGSFIVEPLPTGVCSELTYYQKLFSKDGNGVCYSAILHSFILRSIYDFGFIGLYLTVFIFYKIMKFHLSMIGAIAATGLVLVNGISVSSFNSVYSMLGAVIIILVSNTKLNESEGAL